MERLATGLMLFFSVVVAIAGRSEDVLRPGLLPPSEPPILITACGQGSGLALLEAACRRASIPFHVDPSLRMGDLGAICCADAGCPFGGVLVITLGESLEKMALRGGDGAFEVARCTALVERAKELGMLVLVACLEESVWRGTEEDERLARSILPSADLLIVGVRAPQNEPLAALAATLGTPRVAIANEAELETLLRALVSVPEEGGGRED